MNEQDGNDCSNEGEQQPTLESLAADYLRHLKHHLAQIESAVLT